METYVKVKVVFAGMHYWPDAKNFLRFYHRHLFYITATLPVSHDDRDIEFFEFRDLLSQYISNIYCSPNSHTADFGTRSCEQIAKEILEKFDCSEVEVSEDNENSAIVRRT